MNQQHLIEDFTKFLEASPTAYHAVEEIKKKLLTQGFTELQEADVWKLKASKSYFCTRGGSLIAFTVPSGDVQETLILASHTDSPALKLKPHSEFIKEKMVMLGVEIYGGPLLNSWLNRDLAIAGKVLYENKRHHVEEALVNITDALVTIPQVAIHLDRKVNDEGLLLNKQEHLSALAAIHHGKDKEEPAYLHHLLSRQLPVHEILAHDLFLYPIEKPSLIGEKGEFFAAYRLDSLVSVNAICNAFVEKRKAQPHQLQMIAFWDHEEIGSQSASGAQSPFLPNAIERILLQLGKSREEYLRLISRSLCVSVDLGHAVNPNYPEKHDPQHKPQLGGGVIVKTHAQKRYATDVASARKIFETARAKKIKLQRFAGRNDIPSGSTIGPIQAALSGIPTVDLGIAQLSMHSTRELIATADHFALYTLLKNLL